MGKQELIAYLSRKNRRPQSFYEAAIKELLAGITEQLRSGKSVNFVGFGSFQVKTRKGGKAMNFQTKKPVTFKAYRQVIFQQGALLKKAIRRK